MPVKHALSSRGICVIIPTYNNAGAIASIVQRTMEQCDDVYVVCDGCTDNTLSVLENLNGEPKIISYESNKGKGHALKVGFEQARKDGFAYAITLDADGQHYPEDIPLFLEANREHPGSIIVGSRKGLDNAERSKGSAFANSFSNFWFTLQTGHHLEDTQTGYRLYPLAHLKGLSLLTSRYEAELELLVFAAWAGVDIASIPVNVFYPSREDRVSHFRPGRDFTRISLLNVLLCLLALIYGYPRTILRLLLRVIRTFLSGFLFVFVSMFIVTPWAFLYLSLGKENACKRERLHYVICKVARMGLKLLPGIKYTMVNPNKEDFKKPSVIICNHQSHLDILPMLALTPKIVILTADWVWENPIYGYVIRHADFLPVSRGMEAIAPRLEELYSMGYSIAIYPEGTRSLDCSIGRFHQGAFYIARRLGADILPAVLYGAGKACPKHSILLRSYPICMELDSRVQFSESKGDVTLKDEASSMRRYYKRRYRELADRIDQKV